jgi:hypothetical protein
VRIYTMNIDPERGKYLAISTEDPKIRAFSYDNEEAALGLLVIQHPGIVIDEVVSIFSVEFKAS